MINATQIVPAQSVAVSVSAADLGTLVPGGRSYFDATMREYAQMLLNEAKNIEHMEHTGSGPSEITAAHVEEAKWVLIRRQRRRFQSSRWVIVARVGQTFSTVAVGIGASNFAQQWGAALCLVGVLLGSALFVIEREIDREV